MNRGRCNRVLAGSSWGFTLIEVLVALAIVAVALGAGLQSAAVLANASVRQANALFAGICAENEFVKIRLNRRMPTTGDTTVACTQGGRTLQVTLSVQTSSHPSFRQVNATVRDEGVPLLQLKAVMAAYE